MPSDGMYTISGALIEPNPLHRLPHNSLGTWDNIQEVPATALLLQAAASVTADMSGSKSTEGRRAQLQKRHQELEEEHCLERAEAEELQVELNVQARTLRDHCQEQGQSVSMLAQRLADARGAAVAELQSAAAVRDALGGELMSEESQRMVLEAAHRTEEAEAMARMRAAERQLTTTACLHSTLEAQIQASAKVQMELREHIAAERRGRSELVLAGEKEVMACKEHNMKVHGELQGRIQLERSEANSWQAITAREVKRLHEESEKHNQEENSLITQLKTVTEASSQMRLKLESEAKSWQVELDELRARANNAEEECQEDEDRMQQYYLERHSCMQQRQELEEQLEQIAETIDQDVTDLSQLEYTKERARSELNALREELAQSQTDQELRELKRERDAVEQEVREQTERRTILEAELDSAKSRRFLCWGRRPTKQPKPPSPVRPQQVSRPSGPPQGTAGSTKGGGERQQITSSTAGREGAAMPGVQRNPPPTDDVPNSDAV